MTGLAVTREGVAANFFGGADSKRELPWLRRVCPCQERVKVEKISRKVLTKK